MSCILKLLVVTIGLPFLLLSSTTPLLQRWYDETHLRRENESTYLFYALSNAGSLAGLLIYPLILEREFPLRHNRSGNISGDVGIPRRALDNRGFAGACSLHRQTGLAPRSKAGSMDTDRFLRDNVFAAEVPGWS